MPVTGVQTCAFPISPAEFAAMAVFLASDHAANITGQTINIDGGQVMHS